MFLEISQISQENSCVGVSFFIKLHVQRPNRCKGRSQCCSGVLTDDFEQISHNIFHRWLWASKCRLGIAERRFLKRSNNFLITRLCRGSFLKTTAWKVSVLGVILVCIFQHADWLRRDMEYLSIFSSNSGKYGPEYLQIRTLFTQWALQENDQ